MVGRGESDLSWAPGLGGTEKAPSSNSLCALPRATCPAPHHAPVQLKSWIPNLAGLGIELFLPLKIKCCGKIPEHRSLGPRAPGLAEALGSISLSLPLTCSSGLTQRIKETVPGQTPLLGVRLLSYQEPRGMRNTFNRLLPPEYPSDIMSAAKIQRISEGQGQGPETGEWGWATSVPGERTAELLAGVEPPGQSPPTTVSRLKPRTPCAQSRKQARNTTLDIPLNSCPWLVNNCVLFLVGVDTVYTVFCDDFPLNVI